ncbi:hypothetical protein Tco_0854594 [Tanacetum coccineum]
MSSSSTVTYTSVYTDSKPGRVFWGADEELSDGGSPRVIVYGYDGLPMQPEDPYMRPHIRPTHSDYVLAMRIQAGTTFARLVQAQSMLMMRLLLRINHMEAAIQAPPSPDCVLGLEEQEQAPPLPDYVPGPEHADDEIVAEDQPDVDYPVDYPADGGDDGDDEDEHPAPADDVVVALPTTDQAPSAEETKPFKTDKSVATPPPHPAYRVTARISIPAPVPTPVWSDAEVARLLSISTPPSSPLSPWSSPLPQIPYPSLPLSPPSPVLSLAPPPIPIRLLGYRAAMIQLRAEAASTSRSLPLPPPFILSPTRLDAPSSGIPPPLPISVPTSSPPLLLPFASQESSFAAAARPARGLRADYGFVATMDREIRRDPGREVGYGITDSWDEIVETLQGVQVSTDTELG